MVTICIFSRIPNVYLQQKIVSGHSGPGPPHLSLLSTRLVNDKLRVTNKQGSRRSSRRGRRYTDRSLWQEHRMSREDKAD